MGHINWNNWGIFLSPLEDTVYLAHISKRDGKIVVADDKKDITADFWAILIALFERNNNEIILYSGGKPRYRITLEEISAEVNE